MERMANGIPSATKKDAPDSSLWNLALEGREPLDLKGPSTYRGKLEALRDALEAAWNATPAEKCAPIAKQLQDVLERLEMLPAEEGESELEQYRKRAAGTKSAVRRDRAASGVLSGAHNSQG